MEKPGGLQPMESQRAGHDWATSRHFTVLMRRGNCLSLPTELFEECTQVAQWQRIQLPMQETQETWVWSLRWRDPPGGGNGNPLQCSCLESSVDGGAWQTDYSPMGLQRVRHGSAHITLEYVWNYKLLQKCQHKVEWNRIYLLKCTLPVYWVK